MFAAIRGASTGGFEVASAAAARAHMKDPAHRTKVVLRRLPPAIAQQAVVDQVDARFAGRYDWACFRPGNARSALSAVSPVLGALLWVD